MTSRLDFEDLAVGERFHLTPVPGIDDMGRADWRVVLTKTGASSARVEGEENDRILTPVQRHWPVSRLTRVEIVEYALRDCAADFPEGFRPGRVGYDAECPWCMDEIDWDDFARAVVAALDRL